jgi:ubiquinone biosynthesis protein
MFNFIASIFRLIIITPSVVRIFIVLASSGVFSDSKNRGKNLCIAFKKLGPSFIKLGQTLSVRPDIVGEEIADSLTSLQDKIPPFESKKAIDIIEKELGSPVKELFLEFESEPIAAASIAQVHKAKTINGDEVAVKILRPGIQKKFHRDIKLFFSIARFLKTFKRFRRLRPNAVVNVFAESVKKELDLRMEAAAASELKQNCKNDEGIYVPAVYWQLTSEKVLVTEWINGIPVNDREALVKAGHDLEKITERLSIAFLNQSYRDGFFHADIHPGNLFVDMDGNIAPVDFGIMGRLDKQTKIYVAEILRGFLSGDYAHVAKIHFDAGYVPKHKSELDFMLACRAIGEPIMGLPAAQVSIARLLAMLFKVTEDFEMETQPQLLLLQKTMVLIEGVGQKLYPDVNMWHQAEDWIKIWAKQNISAEAKIKDGAKDMVIMLSDLPEQLKKLNKIIDKLADQ